MKNNGKSTLLLVLATTLAFVLINCSKERVEPTEKLSEYEPATSFLEAHQKQEQVFEIDGDSPGPIIGQDSTKVWIDKEQLEEANGDSVQYPFQVYLLELYTPKDLIFYQISNLSESKLLQNAGVIRIRVMKDGQELVLRNGVKWMVEIPSDQPQTEMRIYYGSEINPGVSWINNPVGIFETNTYGYSGEVEKLGWISCGKPAFTSATFAIGSFVSTTDKLEQLSSFIYLPSSNSVTQVFDPASVSLPVGESTKSILMGMQGSQLFSFYNEREVRSDSNQVNVELDSISEPDLITILDAL